VPNSLTFFNSIGVLVLVILFPLPLFIKGGHDERLL
jgi:hypothetical protein